MFKKDQSTKEKSMKATARKYGEVLFVGMPADLGRKVFAGRWKHPSRRLKSSVKRAIAMLRQVSRPRAMVRVLPVLGEHPYCFLNDFRYRVKSLRISRVLNLCHEAVVCAATLGHQFDAVLADDKLCAYDRFVLDRTASAAMEAVMDDLETTLSKRYCGPGQALTIRYSPGYCDWPIQGQHEIFALLPAKEIGVSLSASCLMKPCKTVTAIMGIGESASIRENGIVCMHCQQQGCPHRRCSHRPAYARKRSGDTIGKVQTQIQSIAR